MSEDKPLHVRVAEALGQHVDLSKFPPGCFDSYGDVPRYDTDWAATGPLIDKYGIDLLFYSTENGSGWWEASRYGIASEYYKGERIWSDADIMAELHKRYESAQEAVCRLILVLAELGKLEKAA